MIHYQEQHWHPFGAEETEIPADPFQKFPSGWKRADDSKSKDKTIVPRISPPPLRRSPRLNQHALRDQRRRLYNQEDMLMVPRRRNLSPTQLPGVRAIPKDFNRLLRGLLAPGEFFAKSHTRYLGPFDAIPTAESLPADDDYILLQRMGRFPDSGKSIFRQVGNLST